MNDRKIDGRKIASDGRQLEINDHASVPDRDIFLSSFFLSFAAIRPQLVFRLTLAELQGVSTIPPLFCFCAATCFLMTWPYWFTSANRSASPLGVALRSRA